MNFGKPLLQISPRITSSCSPVSSGNLDLKELSKAMLLDRAHQRCWRLWYQRVYVGEAKQLRISGHKTKNVQFALYVLGCSNAPSFSSLLSCHYFPGYPIVAHFGCFTLAPCNKTQNKTTLDTV